MHTQYDARPVLHRLFTSSFATGRGVSAAASPCGRTWNLFLQLKGQLERIHNACLYQQYNMGETLRSVHPTNSSITYLLFHPEQK